MISDSERREVAARLRGERKGSLPCFITNAVFGTEHAKGTDMQKLPKRLADLIDGPTCRLRPKEPFSPWGICSECGAFVDKAIAVSDGAKYIDVRYCPNCGAKVVA